MSILSCGMNKTRTLSMLAAGLFPLWSFAQIDLFLSEYTEVMVQTGADTLVPFGDHTNFQFGDNYLYFASIMVDGEVITGGTITGPSVPGGEALELDVDEYLLEAEFTTIAEMEAAVQPGTYTFSGTGNSVGAFSQDIVVPGYSPLDRLKVTNFEALQSFDVSQALTIEWEEFTQGQGTGPNGGFGGLINVEITGFTGSNSFTAWDSESITPDGNFGLLPTTTSVTIPAGTLAENVTYIVNIFFARIDSAVESTSPEGALVATITGYEVEFNIYQEDASPQPTTWAGYAIDPAGWVNTAPWLQYLNVNHAPWIWSDSLKSWLYVDDNGVSSNGGWVYVVKP